MLRDAGLYRLLRQLAQRPGLRGPRGVWFGGGCSAPAVLVIRFYRGIGLNEKIVPKEPLRETQGEMDERAQPPACDSRLPTPDLRPYITAYRFFDPDASLCYTVPAWTRTMMLFR